MRSIARAIMFLGAVLFAFCASPRFAMGADDPLAAGFTNPPVSAKPQTWWHWMNGNITREGITADLEAMHRVGIVEANIITVANDIPRGPVPVMSPQFFDMVEFAAKEADRLGMTLCMDNCPGWSSSGGPWVTPDKAMQFLVNSQTRVRGPVEFERVLAQPPTRLGFYRDVAVLAFRTPKGEEGDPLQIRKGVYEAIDRAGSMDVTQTLGGLILGGALNVHVGNDTMGKDPAPFHFKRLIVDYSYNGKEGRVIVAEGESLSLPPVPLSSFSPKISSSSADFDAAKLLEGNSYATLRAATANQPQYIQMEFAKRITTRTLILTPGPNNRQCSGVIETSEDGEHFQTVRDFDIASGETQPITLGFSKLLKTRHLRLSFDKSAKAARGIFIARIEFTARPYIENIVRKAGYDPEGVDPLEVDRQEQVKADPSLVVASREMVDLTSSMRTDGTLKWSVPEGNWTIERLGYTPTGETNHPAPPEATGLECDKFSRAGLDASWNGMMQPILDRLGPLGGKVLVDCLIDSYETGGQNWTPLMIQEFKKRRGYDPTRLLPVMTGQLVDSSEVSERFLWDLRRTISDLFADNYYGYFTDLCHKHGMKSLIEPYSGPFESLQCGSRNDVPMAEFWAGSNGDESVKMAASVGHIYGQRVIGAESFTGDPEHGRWTDDPYSLKALGDLAFSQGINRFIFHRYAHQPWMNRFPGMTMGPFGINLERTNTWFEESGPWMSYISRSQFLLQQGKCVADVAYFCGESAPVLERSGNPPLPRGYGDDSINADVILHQSSVKNGRLTLDDGESYAVLVLPAADPEMTPAVLEKIRDLVNDGLTVVVGARPTHSPSLENYPRCDEQVHALVEELWGHCDGKAVLEHTLGRGKLIWGRPLAEVLSDLGLKPDFDEGDSTLPLLYTHRTTGTVDIYFVANHDSAYGQADCTFRVSGREPELWHADTGVLEKAPVYCESEGRITVPLQFDPSGSIFVVFRSPSSNEHVSSVRSDEQRANQPRGGSLQIRRAVYEAIDQAGSMDVTQRLRDQIIGGTLEIQVDNQTMGKDPAPEHVKQLTLDYVYNGKEKQVIVAEGASLSLPPDRVRGAPATYEMKRAADGSTLLLALRAGRFVLRSSGASERTLDADASAPVEIQGPWELHFPPNWGAPKMVKLDRLVSWADYPDDGVKYFSGTATYVKDVAISADQLGEGRALYLDLGTVKNLAQVKLNGRDLGILWKPPYRLDITAAANPGGNHLEISVTNLWPNRIIGDLHLPDDVQWSDSKPAAWPQWMLDGKRSPTGRITFYTWRHWDKGDALLPSGLIGPVQLQGGKWIKVE